MKQATQLLRLGANWRGAWQIVRFNWPTYVTSGSLALAGTWIALQTSIPVEVRIVSSSLAALLAGWIVSSLWASHVVYDTSGLYRFQWVKELFSPSPRTWANIHAGLDETSPKLLHIFPESRATVIDVYDPETMKEPSIARARQLVHAFEPFVRGSTSRLPLDSGTQDAVFLIFAAHEARQHSERLRLFKEVHRSLRRGGKLLLVEHLRSLPNFAAFGPGFLHFYSSGEWLNLASEAGFIVFQEFKITPFVGVYLLGRNS